MDMAKPLRPVLLSALFCLPAGLARPGTAPAEFPDRQVTMIVGFSAGCGTDLVARGMQRRTKVSQE